MVTLTYHKKLQAVETEWRAAASKLRRGIAGFLCTMSRTHAAFVARLICQARRAPVACTLRHRPALLQVHASITMVLSWVEHAC